jgi:CRP/FNR family cyclic AMP-dependent transcriptional regulator
MPTDPVYLRAFPGFGDLSEQQLKAVAPIAEAICYPPGQTLFEEGQVAGRLFFLIKGKVAVLYTIGEAGQVRVDAVSGNEIIGCSALIEPYTYTATERTVTEVEVLEVDAVALRELMQRDCRLGLVLQQHIIRVLMERILDLRLGAASP